MPRYFATGKTLEGRSVTEELEADSADEAQRIMEQRGYTDVILHTDDVGALYVGDREQTPAIKPRHWLMFRDLPRPLAVFLVLIQISYQRSWVFNLIWVALLCYRRAIGAHWRTIDTIGVVILLFPVAFAIMTALFSRPHVYNQMIEAFSWGRWDEVLQRIDRGDIPVAPEELAFRKASALAGLGRLDEAIESVEPYGDGHRMPPWLYWSRLGGVYSTAQRHEQGIGCMEHALDLAPENPTVLLDLADSVVQHRRDPRTARSLLSSARSHTLSDILLSFSLQVEGLIALEERRATEARELLESSLGQLSRHRFASPLVPAMLDRLRAHLAIACADCGDTDTAEHYFRQAEPRLRALKRDDLIKRCTQAIGIPSEA